MPSPPRFAAVATISLRLVPVPGRAAACSSLRYAVAVAVSIPIEMPEMTRPMISPTVAGHSRNNRPESMLISTASRIIRRRPTQSDRCPARNKLPTTPTAYAAKITVIMNVLKWSRAW